MAQAQRFAFHQARIAAFHLGVAKAMIAV